MSLVAIRDHAAYSPTDRVAIAISSDPPQTTSFRRMECSPHSSIVENSYQQACEYEVKALTAVSRRSAVVWGISRPESTG